jgi:hypothetical protein
MSYKLQPGSGLESIGDYVAGVCAGLKATPETEEGAAPWDAKWEEIERARQARDRARRQQAEAQARLRLRKYEWDRALLALSGKTLLLAERRTKAEPYASLFGRKPAHQLKQLGVAKAVEAAGLLLQRADALANAALEAEVGALRAATARYDECGKALSQAEAAARVHDVHRRRLLGEVETLIAQTEAQILNRFPGDDERVRAVLAPPRASRTPAASAAEAPIPA